MSQFSASDLEMLENMFLNIPNENARKRLMALWCVAKLKMSAKDAGSQTGLAGGTVSNLCSQFKSSGTDAEKRQLIRCENHGGRRNENVSLEDERKMLLEAGRKAGPRGISINTIGKHYARIYDKPVEDISYHTLYGLLIRHNWQSVGKKRYRPPKPAPTSIE